MLKSWLSFHHLDFAPVVKSRRKVNLNIEEGDRGEGCSYAARYVLPVDTVKRDAFIAVAFDY